MGTWSHYPFGEQWERSGSGGNEDRFTGRRREPETGNDHLGERYLEGATGGVSGEVDGVGGRRRLQGRVEDTRHLHRVLERTAVGKLVAELVDANGFADRSVWPSLTVAQVFRQRAGLNALSLPYGLGVLFRNKRAVNTATLAHEVFHQFDYDDGTIQGFWGLEVDPHNTKNITDLFEKECL